MKLTKEQKQRLIEATLTCVHPLCIRWSDVKKTVRHVVWVPVGLSPLQAARVSFAKARERRCLECHRVIALKHLRWREMNPRTGDYLDTEAHHG